MKKKPKVGLARFIEGNSGETRSGDLFVPYSFHIPEVSLVVWGVYGKLMGIPLEF